MRSPAYACPSNYKWNAFDLCLPFCQKLQLVQSTIANIVCSLNVSSCCCCCFVFSLSLARVCCEKLNIELFRFQILFYAFHFVCYCCCYCSCCWFVCVWCCRFVCLCIYCIIAQWIVTRFSHILKQMIVHRIGLVPSFRFPFYWQDDSFNHDSKWHTII